MFKPSVGQRHIIRLVMSSWISRWVYELHILKVNIRVEVPIFVFLIYSSVYTLNPLSVLNRMIKNHFFSIVTCLK